MERKDRCNNSGYQSDFVPECSIWLNEVIQSLPVPLFIIDKNHRVIHWNKAIEYYTGIKEEDAFGKNMHWKAFYTQERPCLADLILDKKLDELDKWYPEKVEKTIFGSGGYEAVHFYPNLKESGAWLYINAAPIKDEKGETIGAIETFEDITDKKIAQKELLRSHAHYQHLVENINDVLFSMDLNGIITYVSPVIKKMSGYSPEEVEGKHFSVFVHPDDLIKAKKGFAERAMGIFKDNCFRVISKDGSIRYIRTSQTPVLTKNKITGFNYIMTDITDYQLAVMALNKSEEKFRGVAERSSDLIFLAEKTGVVTYAAPSIKTILGYSPEEFAGKKPEDFIHPDDMAIVFENMNYLIENKSFEKHFEVRVRKKDGDFAILDFSGTPVLKDGEVAGIQAIGRDLTEKRKTEKALKDSEERSLNYIKEAAMRLKNPIEIVRYNVSSVISDIKSGKQDMEDIILVLSLQEKNLRQIKKNIVDLNRAIVESYDKISPESKQFLIR